MPLNPFSFGASDFKVQSIFFTSGTDTTQVLTAGVDYEPPSADDNWFIWFTPNAADGDLRQQWHVSDHSNYRSRIELTRNSASANQSCTCYLVEYVGGAGGVNEFIVRDRQVITFPASGTTTNGTAVAGIVDDDQVMTLVTGFSADAAATNRGSENLVTSSWDAANDRPVLTRGDDTNGDQPIASVDVIEWTGSNWTLSETTAVQSLSYTKEPFGVSVADFQKTFVFTEFRQDGGTGLATGGQLNYWVKLNSNSQGELYFGNTVIPSEFTVRVILLESSDVDAAVEFVEGQWTSSSLDASFTPSVVTRFHGVLPMGMGTWDRGSAVSSSFGSDFYVPFRSWMDDTGDWNIDRFAVSSSDAEYVVQLQQWPGKGVRTDFRVQRGWARFQNTTTSTQVAGIHYEAPSADSAAFVRRVGRVAFTGRVSPGLRLDSTSLDDAPGFLANPDISWSRIDVPTGVTTDFDVVLDNSNSTASMHPWELVEYMGEPGGPNEFVVHEQGNINLTGVTTADSATVSGITDDADVMVVHCGTTTDDGYFGLPATSAVLLDWIGGATDVVRATRDSTSNTVVASYAVVEWIGSNWTLIEDQDDRDGSGVGTSAFTLPATLTSLTQAFLFQVQALEIGSGIGNEEEQSFYAFISSTTQWTLYTGANAGADGISYKVSILENADATATGANTEQGSLTHTTPADNPLVVGSGFAARQENVTGWYGNMAVTQSNTGTNQSDAQFTVSGIGGTDIRVALASDNLDTQFYMNRWRWPGVLVDLSAPVGGAGLAGINRGLATQRSLRTKSNLIEGP